MYLSWWCSSFGSGRRIETRGHERGGPGGRSRGQVHLVLARVEDPGGSVVSRLSIDGAEFWLSDESPEHGNFSPESVGGGTARMILTVPDPDAVFTSALAAGAREVFAVEESHGWRLGRMVDPFGHHWEIGRPLGS